MAKKTLTIVEPFYGGSHRYLADFLQQHIQDNDISVTIIKLEAKKWHWRMLASASTLAAEIPCPVREMHNVLLVTAMTNLVEIFGFNPEIRVSYTAVIYYFHENQIEYPKVFNSTQNSFNLIYNQIASCVVADRIYFNSSYNMQSFLNKVDNFLNKLPKTARPEYLKVKAFNSKCSVLYLPVSLPINLKTKDIDHNRVYSVVWPHRWEHDKGYNDLLDILFEINKRKFKIKLSVLGEQFSSNKIEFLKAKDTVSSLEYIEIVQWGRLESRKKYLEHLKEADIVLSTANHEFFGLAILESVICGCYPIVPNKLSYPELYPRECLYNTNIQAIKKIIKYKYSKRSDLYSDTSFVEKISSFHWKNMKDIWLEALKLKSTKKRKWF